MYTVEWDDREGNRQEQTFDSLENARLEASELEKKFDHVAVRKTETKGDMAMDKTTTLQEDFLGQLRRGRHPVTIFTTNGFQLKGRIAAYDQFSILVEDEHRKQNLVYKHAVSTIVRTEA